MNPGDIIARPLALVVALALVGLLPFLFMALTAFVKISTVLQITRSALGASQVPSNTVVLALSGALTLLAMAPVGAEIETNLLPQLTGGAKDDTQLVFKVLESVREPLRGFLAKNAAEKEKARFLELARRARGAQGARVQADDLVVVVPSFIVTELTEAFALGFAIYLPFLVLDLIVVNVLLALGMQAMSPVQVSLPLKLLLFVAADGWGLLAQALVTGYLT